MTQPKTRSMFPIWMFLALAVALAALATAATHQDSPSKVSESSAESGAASEIVLYRTSWCGYCRKADKLLADLDAEFVSKDIENNKEAAREYREKGRGYRGIPLIAYDDQVIKGFDEGGIRAMVRDQKERARAFASASAD